MLKLLASSRPVFSAGGKTLTYTAPAIATKGQLLVLLAGYDAADSFALPAGWTSLVAIAGTAKVAAIARMINDNDPTSIALALNLAAKDWCGQCLLLGGGSNENIVLEASANANFAASLVPAAPLVASQQAVNLELGVWSAAGAHVLTAPAGWTLIDSYSTAIAAAETFMAASVIANATGNLAAAAGASGDAATGTVVSLVLRDQPPRQPVVMFDPIPGNIGLVGTDTRPGAEAGLP